MSAAPEEEGGEDGAVHGAGWACGLLAPRREHLRFIDLQRESPSGDRLPLPGELKVNMLTGRLFSSSQEVWFVGELEGNKK